MIEFIALTIAVTGLGLSLALVFRVRHLEGRLKATSTSLSPPTVSPEHRSSPLQGLRIGLNVSQDHAHAAFVNLLKEMLLAEDVTDIVVVNSGDAPNVDILIVGQLVCNGYAEVYYEAEFTCFIGNEPFCSLVERPPHGDRPSNLALELVKRLKCELDKVISRGERRRALRELSQ
jgi:hypothetical protein